MISANFGFSDFEFSDKLIASADFGSFWLISSDFVRFRVISTDFGSFWQILADFS